MLVIKKIFEDLEYANLPFAVVIGDPTDYNPLGAGSAEDQVNNAIDSYLSTEYSGKVVNTVLLTFDDISDTIGFRYIPLIASMIAEYVKNRTIIIRVVTITDP